MESSEAGAASILFLKNHNAALKLRDFTINQINLNSNITDMTILGKTLEFEHIDTLVLGSVPANELDLVKDNFDCKLFCPDLGLKGFFDAMAHGQYLLGIDPRNSRGVLKLNFPSESSGAFSERINYAYVDGKVGTQVDKEFHQLYNIHNHAKDLRLFSEMKRDKLLRTRIAKSNRGKYYEFFDTFLLYLNGKTPIFLQKYHHLGAVICWHLTYVYKVDCVWIPSIANSFVHTIMYSYYLGCLLKINQVRFIKKYITSLQISQLLCGHYHILVKYRPPVETYFGYFIILIFDFYVWGLIFMFSVFYYRNYITKKIE
jgi:hypothetical protein